LKKKEKKKKRRKKLNSHSTASAVGRRTQAQEAM
jgi:hypothetical protein